MIALGELAHEDRGVSAARHVDGDVLLRPRTLFVAHEDGEFIRVLFAVDQVFVRRVGILAGGRVDGEHAVLGFDPGMRVAHALVAVKGRLQVIDVGTVRVADMASGDAVGQPGTEVHVRSLGIGREGLVVLGHGDGGVGRRVSVGRRTRGDGEVAVGAAEQRQFGPVVGALDIGRGPGFQDAALAVGYGEVDVTLNDFPGIQFLNRLRVVIQREIVLARSGIEMKDADVGFVGLPTLIVCAGFPLPGAGIVLVGRIGVE